MMVKVRWVAPERCCTKSAEARVAGMERDNAASTMSLPTAALSSFLSPRSCTRAPNRGMSAVHIRRVSRINILLKNWILSCLIYPFFFILGMHVCRRGELWKQTGLSALFAQRKDFHDKQEGAGTFPDMRASDEQRRRERGTAWVQERECRIYIHSLKHKRYGKRSLSITRSL